MIIMNAVTIPPPLFASLSDSVFNPLKYENSTYNPSPVLQVTSVEWPVADDRYRCPRGLQQHRAG